MTERDRPDDIGPTGPDDDDVESLLGAHALDAVDVVDRRRVERLLGGDAELRAEADRLDAVADQLAEAGASGATAPPGLWDAIAARLDEPASDLADRGAVPSAPAHDAPARAASVVAAGEPAPVPIGSAPSARRRAGWLLGAAAAVVLVVVGAVAVGARIAEDDTDPLLALEKRAEELASQPGSRTAELVDPDATMGVPVVVDADGHAFVMTAQLPTLAAGTTYQLWSVDGGTPISLGLVGTDSPMAMVGIDGQVQRLALTLEPAGGSAAPTSIPMASGALSEV
jgi:anti-sigma-K factor RskA